MASGDSCFMTMNSTLIADRKSTRLNSSHGYISYAVFCLKKKKTSLLVQPRSELLHAPAEQFGIVRLSNEPAVELRDPIAKLLATVALVGQLLTKPCVFAV